MLGAWTLLVGLAAAPGSIQVVAVETSGPDGGKVAPVIFQVAKSQIKDATVTLQPRPPWPTNGSQGEAIADTARANNVELVIDSTVSRRRVLNIMVVRRTGAVLFDKTTTLPKRGAEGAAKSLALRAAEAARRAVAAVVREESSPAAGEEPPPAPTNAESQEPDAPPPSEEPAPAGTPESPTPSSVVASPPAATSTSASTPSPYSSPFASPWETSKESYAAAPPKTAASDIAAVRLRLMLGLLRYRDRIESSKIIPPLTIDVQGWTLFGAGLELAPNANLSLDLDAGTSSPKLRFVDVAGSAVEITTRYVGTHAVFGGYANFDALSVGGLLGLGYETQSASSQESLLLVPGWTRISAEVGAALAFHRGERRRLSGRVALLLIPWASHKEKPATSGNAPKLFGGRVEAAVRLPVGTLGSICPFVEAGATYEQLKITYTGVGTRLLADGATPAADSKETRSTVNGALSVGAAF